MGEWYIIGILCMTVNTLVLYDNMYHIYTAIIIIHTWSIDLHGATHLRLLSWHEWHWCNGRNFVTAAEYVLLFGIHSQRVKDTVTEIIRFISFFFLLLFKNCYGIGNNVWKLQVSTMKIVPVARIWSSFVIHIIHIMMTQSFHKGDNIW